MAPLGTSLDRKPSVDISPDAPLGTSLDRKPSVDISLKMLTLKRMDRHKEMKPGLTDPKTATNFGGFMTVAGYGLMVLWTFMYVWNVYGSGTNIQSTTAIIPFPSNADNEEVKTLLLPPMKCIAPGGCHVKFMKPYEGAAPGSPLCVYVEEDQAFPEWAREVFQTSDPIDGFTVLWDSPSPNPLNFGISYDRVTLDNKLTGATSTVAAEGASNPGSKKIIQGSTFMQLARTTGSQAWHGSYEVDTWTSMVMTRDGSSVDTTSNQCCHDTATVLLPDGSSSSYPAHLTTCSGTPTPKVEVRIAPMATYTHETVSDWTLSWLSAFGGMLGTTLTVFGAMVTVYKCATVSKSSSGIAGSVAGAAAAVALEKGEA